MTLYTKGDPNLCSQDFGDDFVTLYHALITDVSRIVWNQAKSGCFAFDSDLNQP